VAYCVANVARAG